VKRDSTLDACQNAAEQKAVACIAACPTDKTGKTNSSCSNKW
jgi:hypothetical protein